MNEKYATAKWADIPLLVLDTETTGVRNSDTICEISIGVFNGGVVEELFTTYVDPEQPIPANVTEIHGIRDRDVIGAPKIGELLPKLRPFFELEFPIVAHGLAFDARMLLKTEVAALWPRDVPTLCTLDFAKHRNPMCAHMPNHQLRTVSTYLGMYKEREGMHRAEADVYALGEMIPRLMDKYVVGTSFTKLSQDWLKPAKAKK